MYIYICINIVTRPNVYMYIKIKIKKNILTKIINKAKHEHNKAQ